MFKKALSAVSALSLAVGIVNFVPNVQHNVPMTANALEEDGGFELVDGTHAASSIKAYGDCGAEGSNLTWMLDDKGVLTVSGKDEMDNFTSVNSPWSDLKDDIRTVIIKDGVTSVGNYAFSSCTYLDSVTIGKNVAKVGIEAFYETPWLEAKQKENPLVIVNSILIDAMTCSGDIIIPSNVTGISGLAFAGSDVASVVMPDSVIDIGQAVFYNCPFLKEVRLSKNITSLDTFRKNRLSTPSFFGYCENLETVVIPEGVKYIDEKTFSWCESLTHIDIPDSVLSIGESAFSQCSSLTSVVMGNNVRYIGKSAFSGCSALESVTVRKDSVYDPDIASDVEESIVDDGAFSRCSQLKTVEIPDGIKYIDDYAFFNGMDSLETIGLGSEIEAISFWSPQSVKEINISSDNDFLLSIDGIVYNKGLTRIERVPPAYELGDYVVPNNITEIGALAFYECSELTSVRIPKSVVNIDNGAFYWCKNLQKVTIENPDCDIYYDTYELNGYRYGSVFCNGAWETKGRSRPYYNGVISGYTGSTAQEWAEYYDYQFEPIAFDVKFDANGGTVYLDSISVVYGSNYGALPAPERDGYAFLGWYTEKDGGTRILSDTIAEMTEAQTLYAHWNKIKVDGDANCDGIVSIADATAILQHLGNRDKYALTAQGEKNADVDGQAGITASDALTIQQYDAKLISKLPVA